MPVIFIVVLESLNIKDVTLIETSGGVWGAVNAALRRSDLITCVVADSFDGRTLRRGFAKALIEE